MSEETPKALYRKYRPGTWDQVSGQEHVTQTLRNAVSGGQPVILLRVHGHDEQDFAAHAVRLLFRFTGCPARSMSGCVPQILSAAYPGVLR